MILGVPIVGVGDIIYKSKCQIQIPILYELIKKRLNFAYSSWNFLHSKKGGGNSRKPYMLQMSSSFLTSMSLKLWNCMKNHTGACFLHLVFLSFLQFKWHFPC